MGKNLLKLLCVSLLTGFCVFGWLFFIKIQCESSVANTKTDLIRLHIIANSDDPWDQQLKLKVRDAVINYLSPYFATVSNKEEAKNVIREHEKNILMLARQVMLAQGADYEPSLEIGQFEFPVKVYGSLVLPAGTYEAVRIKIGQAEGRNWWCVLFPPLCFVDGTVAAAPSPNNTENQTNEVQIRWKIFEILNVSK